MAVMTQMRITLPGPTLTNDERMLRTEVFWNTLQSYSIDSIEKAATKAIARLHFFPTPSEIIDIISIGDEEGSEKFLEWTPTEEGKQKAREFVQRLEDKWAKQDEEKEKIRKVEFEKRRKILQGQKKLLGVE